jgi:hypothetical protein
LSQRQSLFSSFWNFTSLTQTLLEFFFWGCYFPTVLKFKLVEYFIMSGKGSGATSTSTTKKKKADSFTAIKVVVLDNSGQKKIENVQASAGSVIFLSADVSGLGGPCLGALVGKSILPAIGGRPPLSAWAVRPVVFAEKKDDGQLIGKWSGGPVIAEDRRVLDCKNYPSEDDIVNGLVSSQYKFVFFNKVGVWTPGQVIDFDSGARTLSVQVRDGVDVTVVSANDVRYMHREIYLLNGLAGFESTNTDIGDAISVGGLWSKAFMEQLKTVSNVQDILANVDFDCPDLVERGTLKFLGPTGLPTKVVLSTFIIAEVLMPVVIGESAFPEKKKAKLNDDCVLPSFKTVPCVLTRSCETQPSVDEGVFVCSETENSKMCASATNYQKIQSKAILKEELKGSSTGGKFKDLSFASKCEVLLDLEFQRADIVVRRDTIFNIATGEWARGIQHVNVVDFLKGISNCQFTNEKWNIMAKPPLPISSLRGLLDCLRSGTVIASLYYREDVRFCFSMIYEKAFAELSPLMSDGMAIQLVYCFMNFYAALYHLVCSNAVRLACDSLAEATRVSMADDGHLRQTTVTRFVSTMTLKNLVGGVSNSGGGSAYSGGRSRTGDSQKSNKGGANPPNEILRRLKSRGKDCCLRFNSSKGCSFPHCKFHHDKVDLNQQAKDYIIKAHGGLSDH